ncbi:MAG: hypothetical protein KKD48_03880, partial [Nanoarchaeota archaeon]|nr:hypothetical protein [Nanoarchaeota archaeon]
REINKYKNFPSEIVFRRYFGRYNGALKEIGFKPNVIRDYTKEKLIISLENLKKELKRTPKLKDFRNKSLNAPSECTYFKYFKSFNNALKEAGIKINRRRDYTNEELIDCLKNEAEKLRRTPTAVEVQKSRNCPGINTYKEHFGTYNKAVLLAGLKRNRGYNGEKWKFWQKHCEDMARVLYSNVIIQAKLKDIRGNPDILIPKENKFIDAKTSGYNDFKDQIKRYVIKNGASLEFWCIFKGIETKHPKVKYIYANELAMRMDKIGRKDLAIKCCQFLTGSEDQKLLVVK